MGPKPRSRSSGSRAGAARAAGVESANGSKSSGIAPGVELVDLEAVGNYAVQPTFSDGHNTGIYSWDLLYELGEKQAELWATYERRLLEAGVDRDTPMIDKSGHACGSH